MTLLVAAVTEKSIWMLTDRRISRRYGPPIDDAVKLIELRSARDGDALIGYFGVGLTIGGQQPSNWLARVVRGRDLSVMEALDAIAAASKSNLIPHVKALAWTSKELVQHTIVAAARINNEPRLYSIDLLVDPYGTKHKFRYVRLVTENDLRRGKQSDPYIFVGGSGESILKSSAYKRIWYRRLLRLIRAHDKGDVKSETVAAAFSQINDIVHRSIYSVGPSCIVSAKTPTFAGHVGYTNSRRELTVPPVPAVWRGEMLHQLIESISRQFPPTHSPTQSWNAEGAIQAALTEYNALPLGPDSSLK